MAILWDTDPAAVETYRIAIGDPVRLVESGQQVTQTLASAGDELLVVIGPDIDIQAACDLTTQIRFAQTSVGVVLLRQRPEVTILAQALRAGIREVVAAEDLIALTAACRRSMELSLALAGAGGVAAGARKGRVVTVFSAKGGVGKTTIATNLGVYLASTGSKVLLVDLDLAFGDVAVSLQLAPSRSASDLVALSGQLDTRGLASAVTRHDSGLDTLCAPDRPTESEDIPPSTTKQLLEVAKSAYDIVIVDTPPVFSEHVLFALDVTDVFLLIATMDVPAVKNLRLVLDTLDQLGYPRQSRVVVLNRFDAKVGLKTSDVEAATRQPVALCIPNSLDVPASINRGVAIVVDNPTHPVSAALRKLADVHVRPGPGTDATKLLAKGPGQAPSQATRRDPRTPRRRGTR